MDENLEILTILEDEDDISISSIEEINNNKELADCIICMQIILPNEYVSADHGFIKHPYGYHLDCWKEYREKTNKCPLCRENLLPTIQDFEDTDDNLIRRFIIRPHEIQYMEMYAQRQLITIETLMFVSTLGHSLFIGFNNPVAITALKTCVSFFVTCRGFSAYLNRFHNNPLKYIFSFYICYTLVNSLMHNYCFFLDAMVSEIEEYLYWNNTEK